MPVIPYGRQEITAEDIEAVTQVLKSDFLTQGPEVDRFENDFATAVGAKYAVAVNNGTAALHLAILALGLKPGEKVLCATMSFAASANCVLYAGGEVEFVDIDPETYCVGYASLKEKLSKAPKNIYKGLIAVDFAGYPALNSEIIKLAKENNLWILEDACHAPGAEIKNDGVWQKAGSITGVDLAVFSFHPVKHITTGEGGMITTQNETYAKKMKNLRTHGITKNPAEMSQNHGGWYMEMQALGYNYRISDILCALGRSQLSRLKENIVARQKIAQRYQDGLSGLDLVLPKEFPDVRHAYHLYAVQSPKRKDLYDFLKGKNIFAQVHYIPIHQHPYYREKYGNLSLPVAEAFYQKTLSLPMYHSLSVADQNTVIKTVREFHGK